MYLRSFFVCKEYENEQMETPVATTTVQLVGRSFPPPAVRNIKPK